MTTVEDAVRTALGGDAWLFDALQRAARGRAETVEAYLHHFEPPTHIDGTRATCRAHFIVCGADGKPRVEQLTARLAGEVTDYCIPRDRLEEASQAFIKHKATYPLARLQAEAKSLFTHLEKSGEGGELLLYLLLETVLRIPQVLCKMPLKTSSQMHVHGADGVHAKALEDGRLAIYWGESKLYSGVADAVRECLDSLSEILAGSPAVRGRDMLLLRDHATLDDPDLTRALRAFFDDDDVRSARVEFRGACLVGFDQDRYPDVRSGGPEIEAQVAATVKAWVATVKKRIGVSKLTDFELEVFCVPFPSVEKFRAAIGKELRA